MDNFSYSFLDHGLFCIFGKSGSGKSTIANLAALFDKPSSGKILYKGQDISKWKKTRIDYFHAHEVVMVFQHYNLLLDKSVIDNVLIPTQALLLNQKESKEKAMKLLKEVGIGEELFNQSAKDLSGGEMQRVAICRALINEPSIIIADEPTGALDEENSVKIMEILKKISKTKLVILISHNKSLVERYHDYIIELQDGKRVNIDTSNKTIVANIETEDKKIKRRKGHDDRWIVKSVCHRLKKNIVKNTLIGLSLMFSYMFIFTMIGFIQGADNVCQNMAFEKLDFGNCSLSKIERRQINNSALSLDKLTKYSNDDLLSMKSISDYFHIQDNFDFFIEPNSNWLIAKQKIKGISLAPIYSFDETSLDPSLVIRGSFPNNNKKILINELADKKIKEALGLETSIGQYLTFNIDKEIKIHSYNEINLNLTDKFVFDKTYQIIGIVKEFSFLSTPKIYISTKQIQEELEIMVMPNLSYELNKEITFFDYVHAAKGDEELSSYKHNLFLKDIKDVKHLVNIINELDSQYDIHIQSDSIVILDTFTQLLDSAKFGVIIFVLIAGVGALLILGVSSFSSYIYEKRNTAIMFAFGFSRDQMFSLFSLENIFISSLAFVFSILLTPLFIYGLNALINKLFGIDKLIKNVLAIINFRIIAIGFCLFLLISIFVYIATLLPMLFANKINIKEELSSND